MAKQLELRRGTTQANNLFTGAIGEVTMDTDTKQLRVHDGVKAGGYALDTLVAFQAPTAGNNYTWYRKYASGWVEQGGRTTTNGQISSTNKRITLPIVMANPKYYVEVAENANSGNATLTVGWESTTAFSLGSITGTSTGEVCWQVKGMAA